MASTTTPDTLTPPDAAPAPVTEAEAEATGRPGFVEDSYRLHRRFDRMGRLVGDPGMAKLLAARVMVVGLGGVGSFAAEALARSGVGHLILVDFDKVCITNSNRQLQAMKGEIGRPKADVLAERLERINPQATIEPVRAFYTAETSDVLLAGRPDVIVDAIDNVTAKCHLLATCVERRLPVICSTGASGRLDPTAIATADLAETRVDPLASRVRKNLRRDYGFPEEGPFGIPSVFSTEPARMPVELEYDHGEGFRCVCPGGTNPYHSCEHRNVIYGTAGFVTGAFGLACASLVVRHILG